MCVCVCALGKKKMERIVSVSYTYYGSRKLCLVPSALADLFLSVQACVCVCVCLSLTLYYFMTYIRMMKTQKSNCYGFGFLYRFFYIQCRNRDKHPLLCKIIHNARYKNDNSKSNGTKFAKKKEQKKRLIENWIVRGREGEWECKSVKEKEENEKQRKVVEVSGTKSVRISLLIAIVYVLRVRMGWIWVYYVDMEEAKNVGNKRRKRVF